MIPRTVPTWQGQSWQEQLIDSIRDWDELCETLQLSPRQLTEHDRAAGIDDAIKAFPLKVPRHYASLMGQGNPRDPLLLQVLPQAQEMLEAPGFSLDPLAETAADAAAHNQGGIDSPGIIQKYRSRVLLMLSGSCAVHCRYCFRRHFPYQQHLRSRKEWAASLTQIADDPDINEIILSGGDPLSASDRLLGWLVDEIQRLPHITTLRIHTRLPVVIPDRLDAGLLQWIGRHPQLQKVLVLHCNHPHEVSPALAAGVNALRKLGIHVLNQSVLLKGVNDQAETLAALSEALFKIGVLPYYLHLLDKVTGTHHFEVEEHRARQLHQALSARLPGYLVPKLAREIPGQASKTVLA